MPLLAPSDTFEVFNSSGNSEILLVCDHASNKVPLFLEGLGLTNTQINDHIAWDPGAADVARELALHLDATLVLSGYSRLVIDCNRSLISPLLIAPCSDGVVVPKNQGLTDDDRAQRIDTYFKPYHQTIQQLLDDRAGRISKLLSIHSFSPALAEAGDSAARPWHIGVSYKEMPTFADRLYAGLKQYQDLCVGYHQPYAVDDEYDFTLIEHGFKRKLEHAMIEIRQDQLISEQQTREWAFRILSALTHASGEQI